MRDLTATYPAGEHLCHQAPYSQCVHCSVAKCLKLESNMRTDQMKMYDLPPPDTPPHPPPALVPWSPGKNCHLEFPQGPAGPWLKLPPRVPPRKAPPPKRERGRQHHPWERKQHTHPNEGRERQHNPQ